jgi:polar amino acid transport system substrate-binding protein
MNPRRYAWLLIGCMMLSAGCSSTRDDRLDSSVEQLDITPAPTPPTSSSAASKCKSDYPYYLASLRPEGPLPSPNNLPARSFMSDIRKKGSLTVGVDQNTKLLGYYNPNTEQFEGFDVDLAREIARAIFGDLKNRINYVALLTGQRITAVQSGRVDIVADAVTINCPRTKVAAFSNVYFMAHQRVLVRLDSKAKTPGDLRGKKVCATTGSTALENLKNKLPYVVPYPVPARTDCLVALQQGNVEGILTDDSILYGFLAQDPHTKLLDGNITNEPYGLAIRKDHPEFVRFVNAVLEHMHRRWTDIWTKWFRSVQIRGGPAKAPVQPPAYYRGDQAPAYYKNGTG